MPLPTVLTSVDLPEPELGGMRLDGEVYPLAEGWCSIDVLETPAHRARAVRGLRSEAGKRIAAERTSRSREFSATTASKRIARGQIG